MSNAQRQERQFDEAAEQARADGCSSFGIGFERYSAKRLAVFEEAAQARGCTFEVDTDGAGLFVCE